MVILRYPAADPSGPGLVSRLPVVTEHHSWTLAEMASYESSRVSFGARQMKRVRHRMELKYGEAILRNSRGLIAVTDEIRQHELERANGLVPSLTVPNGIEVEGVVRTGFVPFSGNELHIAFVAANLRPWHGLDRLATGLRHYEGLVPVSLHLIGDIPASSEIDVRTQWVTTTFHGTLQGKQLDNVLSRVNLAFGSLGVHRKQMREACNLKTREYMARGLPFVISHDDPDLRRSQSEPFFMRLSADDTAVDIARVVDFARSVADDQGPSMLSRSMRRYAAEHMAWLPKMAQYVRFCEAIVGQK